MVCGGGGGDREPCREIQSNLAYDEDKAQQEIAGFLK